jgi:probable HAF family extracellular repeat protein
MHHQISKEHPMNFQPLISRIALTLSMVVAMPLWLAARGHQHNQNQPHYVVVNLGTDGGTASAANAINNLGWAMGSANLPGDTTEHATVWIYGQKKDLGTLGGANSSVPWPAVKNTKGLIVGVSDTSIVDPLGEIWSCAEAFFPSSTGHTCQGFLWKKGEMSALPTLGGSNGVATGINNQGYAVGWAENTIHDSTCIAPQVLQFEAVLYGKKLGQIMELPPLAGDVDGAATAINDKNLVVGISGICANAIGGATAAHSVLWQNGTPIDIGNLGGVAWNTPTSINNHDDVVGFSDLPGDSAENPNYHAFHWTKTTGIHDLGTLPGDIFSIAWSINNRGQIVGQSIGPNGSRAVVWHDGMITDLNTLIQPGSVTLVYANDIDDSGMIVGGASDSKTGKSPAFLAIPANGGNSH